MSRASSLGRSTTTRDRHRAYLARGHPPCHICNEAIDYQLPHDHPRSYVVDHVTPLSRGGSDLVDNKAPAHRDCNEGKAAKTPAEIAAERGPRVFVTERLWTA